MSLSHSNMIEISKGTFIGVTDKIVYVVIKFTCIRDNCESLTLNLCKLDDLLNAAKDTHIENTVEYDSPTGITITLIYKSEYSYFDFLDAIDKLNQKWNEIDCIVKCNCYLKDEMIKAHDGFLEYIEDIIAFAQKED